MVSIIQTIVAGLMAGSVYSLVAAGIALIFGVIELVNFAHAEYLMIAMYVAYWCHVILGLDPYLALPIVLLVMILLGLLTYRGVMQRVLNAPHEIQILATVSIMMILQNLALILWGANYRNVRTAYSNATLQLGGIYISVPKLIASLVAIGVSTALYLYLQKTYTGSAIRAISQNNKAAQLVGIKLNNTYRLAFTMGISMVAFAGVVLMPIYPAYPMSGASFLLPAFIVVVIGGLSSIPGAIISGLLVGVIESMTAYLMGPEYQQLAYFILFLFVLVLKPEGIMSRASKKVKV